MKTDRWSWRLSLLSVLLASAGAGASCTVSSLGVAFGNYNPIADLALDGVGSVSVDCGSATSFSLRLSTGAGSYSARQMNSGGATLVYNLYADPAHSTVWGDGSAGTVTVDDLSTSETYNVYGRIAAGQSSTPVGSYSDLVVVTVEF